MTFSLGGKTSSSTRLYMPIYGVHSAEIELDGEHTLSGRQTLIAGDLSCIGTIVEGGPVAGRSRYYWVGGAAGWRKVIDARGYSSAAGVLQRSIIADAAADCSEVAVYGLPEVRVGLAPVAGYTRPAAQAWTVLRELRVPWWLDAQGITHIAERPTGVASTKGTEEAWEREDGFRVICPDGEAIATYLPGRTYAGELIRLMRITALENEPIRVELRTGRTLRDLTNELIQQQSTRYFGKYRYKITSQNGTLYDVAPIDPSLGLPALTSRDLRMGVAGATNVLPDDFEILIEFADGLLSQPIISGFFRASDYSSSLPLVVSLNAQQQILLGAASKLVARQDDPVLGLRILASTDPGTMIKTIIFQDSASGAVLTLAFSPAGTLASMVPSDTTASPIGAAAKIGTPTQDKVFA